MSTCTLLAFPDDDDPRRRARGPVLRTKAGGEIRVGDEVNWKHAGLALTGRVVPDPDSVSFGVGWPTIVGGGSRPDGSGCVWVRPEPFPVPVELLGEPAPDDDQD